MRRITDLFGHLRIYHKMLLIYIIGGMLPLIVVGVFLTTGTKQILVQKAEQAEQQELCLIKQNISESLRVATEVSEKLAKESILEELVGLQYKSKDECSARYGSMTLMTGYLSDYGHELEQICLYVTNETMEEKAGFVYADELLRMEAWYQQALAANGTAFWCSRYDDALGKTLLSYVQPIPSKQGELTGVLVVSVRQSFLQDIINSRGNRTAIIFDNTIVAANAPIQANEVYALLHTYKDSLDCQRVQYMETEHLFTVRRFFESGVSAEEELYLISLQPYEEIVKEINIKIVLANSLIAEFIMLSILLIVMYSLYLDRRIDNFRKQIRKAATGDFHIKKRIGGYDEISDLYQALYSMIDSMQQLMAAVGEEKLQKEQLYSRQREVEFKMLASQINPHFLYNTLETIRMKARANKQPEIEELVKMLARLMRRNIQVGDTLVSFQSELELVEFYLKIQQYRFGERIRFQIELNCDIEDYKIMPLLIQPIVENAFVHGLETKERGGLIRVVVEKTDKLQITVIDDGCGIPPQRLKEIRETMNQFGRLDESHIGLGNVNQRIQLLYGEAYGLKIESEWGKGTRVEMTLPL